MTTQRHYLEQHTQAHRDIELIHSAIQLLERVSPNANIQRLIRILQSEQQPLLAKLDRAAHNLGAK